jgi:DNA-binding beta-propeller fold protein YncE
MMEKRNCPATPSARIAALLGAGLMILGCDPGTTDSNADGSGGSGPTGGSSVETGGRGGSGQAAAGGSTQGNTGGRTQDGSGGGSQGGAGGSGSTGGVQGGAGAINQGGAGGPGQAGAGGASQGGTGGTKPTGPIYRSPYAIAYSGDAASLALSDLTAGELVVLDGKTGTSLNKVKLNGEPKGLAWSGNGKVLVAEYGSGTIAEVDAKAGSVLRRVDVGPKPTDVAVSPDGERLVVPDFAQNKVYIIENATGKTQATVPVAPYPFAVSMVPDSNTAVVSHLVASGDATKSDAAASVSILDLETAKVNASIRLPFGSSSARGVRCSPDGKWAYAVHTLGRVNVPTTHIFRGWINTNALSIIDLSKNAIYATVLLDRISQGAADPWGVDVSADGKVLWVSTSGMHQVLRVDLDMLHKLLAGPIPSELVKAGGRAPTATNRNKDGYNRPLSDVWFDIAANPAKRSLLIDDLGALYSAGLLKVIPLESAQGPRGVALSPDGKQLAVALYFAGQVGLVNTSTAKVERFIDVGTQPDETWERQGERLFHDASTTVQGWLSCATCHPDGRADGLNWDLLNDGAGNVKNAKSMVYSANTPPAMAHGVRANTGVAITAGFKYIKFVVPDPEQEYAVATFMNALTAEPYGRPGERSEAAQRGASVFEKAECGKCHTGPYTTDKKMYDVGTKNVEDTSAEFDTPTLADLWRSAPYLHDGTAPTLKEVLTTKNAGDKHGKTSGLSDGEIDDLVQYLLELDVPTPEKVELFTAPSATPPKATFRGVTPTASKGGLDLTDPKLAVLDKILFIKRAYLPTNVHDNGGHICDQYHGFNAQKGGGLFILENVLSGSPTEKNVLASSVCANGPHQGKRLEGGGFLSPDLSYDAKQILFAYTDVGQFKTWTESSTFHIFKVNVDGTGLTQLTEGKNNDFDPTWLPDGRIVFISDRRGGYGRCHPRTVPVYTMYIMNADGTGIEPLSLHETNEWQPSVDQNGQIIYTRWDYVDRGSNQVHHPWITTPDGLDPRATVGNYGTRQTVTPRAVMNIRAIPGSTKLVGTAGAHHQQAYGSILRMDQDIEDDDGMAQYTVITKDAGFPEATVGIDNDHKYATAWPIDEDRFLVVHDPNSNQAGLTGKRFAIYLIDSQGNKKQLYKDPSTSCLDPIPLAPRERPLVMVPSRSASKTASAEVNLLNVYDSMLPLPTGVEIKALRVVQVYPKSTPNTISPKLGHGAVQYNDQNGRGSLGTVPVEKDGSAHFLLPPGKPVFFQALDANGAAVQSMMSDTYIVPGSSRLTCQGCHERRYRAPANRSAMPIAFGREASKLVPEPDGSAPLSFARLIQPILDKKCVSCHGSAKPGDLSKGNYQSDPDRFYTSYKNLRSYVSYYDFDYSFGPVVTTPGKFGALHSRLYPLLKDGHQGVTLTSDELRAFVVWLDLNSDMYSDDVKRDAQARGEAVTPSIE